MYLFSLILILYEFADLYYRIFSYSTSCSLSWNGSLLDPYLFAVFLIGSIFVGSGFYNLGKELNEITLKIGEILIAIPFLNLVGFILVFIGLSS
ncbi:hypothetical protein SJAV_18680 [Sulfurisphaera javensis]|uniref:Uncharacterized protein n=1 Tax=Sulfurisphaera javensis TaxID=2049879 RepID=A0AAT9GSR3_9CREN